MFSPQPKPQARILDKVATRRAREAEAQAFRQAIWLRDGAKCRNCDKPVIRTLELIPKAGHVHHRHGRNVRPEDRYNVDMAVLLCALCHKDPAVIHRFRGPR